MEENTASRSAAIIAAHRAMESAKPSNERICYDLFAEKLIAPNVTVIGETDMPREQALSIFKQFVPGFHEYFLARTRYIDDYLESCINNGLQQLVILGAGYDSRAYRFESLKEEMRVFEVDHPATQAVKKDKLKRIFNNLPSHVAYVPLDFQQEDLGGGLFNKGYNNRLKTLFIWEGVTMYLDPESVDKVLSFIAGNSGSGSSIIFDFTSPEVVQGTDERPEAVAWRQKTTDTGEPLRFGIGLDSLVSFLETRHFTEISYVTHDYFNRSYFDHPEDNRAATPILAIAQATMQMNTFSGD